MPLGLQRKVGRDTLGECVGVCLEQVGGLQVGSLLDSSDCSVSAWDFLGGCMVGRGGVFLSSL